MFVRDFARIVDVRARRHNIRKPPQPIRFDFEKANFD
jgi:hypothetical protein